MIPSDATPHTSDRSADAARCTKQRTSTALDLLDDREPAIARRKWSCGEADWLTEVGHVERLKTTTGYPLHFGVREVLELMGEGISPTQAMACGKGTTVDQVLAACRS